MYRLVNPVQNYAWGMRTAIAELLGEPVPSEQPQAELWLGAHPSAPSRVVGKGSERTLTEAIDAAPRQLLGPQVLAKFGARLPFLLKVLAVDQPLSLQAHPDLARAAAGFAAEQERRIALDDPGRNYRDANHKPELICALTPFDALCGLRPIEEIAVLIAELDLGELGSLAEVDALISSILCGEDSQRLVETVVDRCGGAARESPFAPSYRCALGLAERFPGDPGVVMSLLLNLIHLRPGEATYLPPGRLHAYLHGVGIEVMASSDNVLRGGLTSKHVDVHELLSAAELDCAPAETVPVRTDGCGWFRYHTPATDFALATARLDNGSITSDVNSPQILLCVDGALTIDGQPLARGQSVFVPAGDRVNLTGTGLVFRATTGLG